MCIHLIKVIDVSSLFCALTKITWFKKKIIFNINFKVKNSWIKTKNSLQNNHLNQQYFFIKINLFQSHNCILKNYVDELTFFYLEKIPSKYYHASYLFRIKILHDICR